MLKLGIFYIRIQRKNHRCSQLCGEPLVFHLESAFPMRSAHTHRMVALKYHLIQPVVGRFPSVADIGRELEVGETQLMTP